jgi:hypothetical protein
MKTANRSIHVRNARAIFSATCTGAHGIEQAAIQSRSFPVVLVGYAPINNKTAETHEVIE